MCLQLIEKNILANVISVHVYIPSLRFQLVHPWHKNTSGAGCVSRVQAEQELGFVDELPSQSPRGGKHGDHWNDWIMKMYF